MEVKDGILWIIFFFSTSQGIIYKYDLKLPKCRTRINLRQVFYGYKTKCPLIHITAKKITLEWQPKNASLLYYFTHLNLLNLNYCTRIKLRV